MEWCVEHYRLPAESSSAEGRFRPAPYQRGLLSLMASDGGPERVVLMKAARVGYSAAMCAAICYAFGRARRHVTIYQPSNDAAKAFSKGTVMPAVQACPAIQDLVESIEDRRKVQSVAMARIGGKMLRIVGATSPLNFREFSSDWVFIDEVDALKPRIGEEGSPVALAARSIKNSPFRRMVAGGTPTTEDALLWGEWLDAALRMKFVVPCPECGEKDDLRWGDLRFAVGGSDAPLMVCRANGCLWGYERLPEALSGGEWRVPEMQPDPMDLSDPDPEPYAGHVLEVTSTGPVLVSPGGSAVEWPNKVALHVNALYSQWWSWSKAVEEWTEAQGSVIKQATFANHVLGEPWRGQGDTVYPADLAARRERLDPLPSEVLRIVVGVDVQGEHLSVLVVGWSQDMTAFVLDRIEFHGRVISSDGAAWVQFVDWLLSKPTWEVEDGTRQGIDAVAVDSGYATVAVYAVRPALSKAVGRHAPVFCVKGVPGPKAAVIAKGVRRDKAGRQSAPAWRVGDYQAGREILSMLSGGRVRIAEGLPNEVLLELCSMDLKRVRHAHKGTYSLEFSQTYKANEAWDCLKYAYAVMQVVNKSWRLRRASSEASRMVSRGATGEDDGWDSTTDPLLPAEMREKQRRGRRKVPRGRMMRRPSGRMRPILC